MYEYNFKGDINGRIMIPTPVGEVDLLALSNNVNAKQSGAGSLKKPEENKVLIQSLIDESTEESGKAGRIIIIPRDCEYGYTFDDPLTYLDLSGEKTDCVIFDYTAGIEVTAGGLKKHAGQQRIYMCSPGLVEQNEEQTGIGNTFGNTTLIKGLWNPGVLIENDGINIDNRRAKIYFGSLGNNDWSVGQGNMTIPYDPENPNEVSGLNEKKRKHFHIAGKIADGTSYINLFVIRKDDGNVGFFIQEPTATYHLKQNPVDGLCTFLLERTGGGSPLIKLKSDDFTGVLKLDTDEIIFAEDGQVESFKFMKDGSVITMRRRTEGDLRLDLRTLNGGTKYIKLVDTTGNMLFEANSRFVKGVSGGSYTTTNRNALTGLETGTMVYDTTLSKPIWWNGSVWKDSAGTTV